MGRPRDKGDSPRDEGRRESGRAAPHHTSDKTSRADSYGGDLSPPAAGLHSSAITNSLWTMTPTVTRALLLFAPAHESLDES